MIRERKRICTNPFPCMHKKDSECRLYESTDGLFYCPWLS